MVTLNERTVFRILLGIILGFLALFFFLIGWRLTYLVCNILMWIVIIEGIWYVIQTRKLSKGLPLSSRYDRYNNLLEFHIDKTDDIHVIFNSLINLINIGRQRQQNIVFLTWHIEERALRKIFGMSARITHPKRFCAFANLFSAALILQVPRWIIFPSLKYNKSKNLRYLFVEIDSQLAPMNYNKVQAILRNNA